jgi:serine/threonine protein kinase
MLTAAGTKLLDFGLAKHTVGAAGQALSVLATAPGNGTAQGTIIGTLQYMAPEQVQGAAADARTDIFAFGTILYEMATGRRAFEAKTQASLIAKILETDVPALSTLTPPAPPLARSCATGLCEEGTRGAVADGARREDAAAMAPATGTCVQPCAAATRQRARVAGVDLGHGSRDTGRRVTSSSWFRTDGSSADPNRPSAARSVIAADVGRRTGDLAGRAHGRVRGSDRGKSSPVRTPVGRLGHQAVARYGGGHGAVLVSRRAHDWVLCPRTNPAYRCQWRGSCDIGRVPRGV